MAPPESDEPDQTADDITVMHDGGMVHVRVGTDPDSPKLAFTLAEWAAFIEGARNGDFDFG